MANMDGLIHGRRQALVEKASCLLTELEFVTIHLRFTIFLRCGDNLSSHFHL